MENRYKNLLPYVAIAVAVFIVVVVAGKLLVSTSYSLSTAITSADAGAIYPYQISNFNIIVTNTGSAPISGMVVGLYLDGSELQHYVVTVPGHKNATIRYNYTYRQDGNFTFMVVADPGRIMNIVDRGTAQNTLIVEVSAPELPNVYKTVPNLNVTETQSFSASGTGMYSLSAVEQAYYLKIIDNVFGPSKNIMIKVVDNLYGYVAKSYGADVEYENGTAAYVLWIEGTATPSFVDYIVSSFRVPQSSAIVGGKNVIISQTGNNTSMCTFYSNGWTKIVAYNNNSLAGNCLTILNRTYEPYQSTIIVNALNNSKELSHYQSGFLYVNSSTLGSSLISSDKGIGVLNMFQNQYGFFISEVVKTEIPNNSATMKCYGIIYSNNGMNVCSSVVVPTDRGAAKGFGLVNSTAITKDYIINMYSLVNDTQFIAAHSNAASLINALVINQSTIAWTTVYNNTCAFDVGAGLSCAVDSFDFATEVLNMSITNHRSMPITINSAICQIPSYNLSDSIGISIGSNSTTAISVQCHGVPALLHSQTSSYTLVMNYSYNNASASVAGLLNVSSAGFN